MPDERGRAAGQRGLTLFRPLHLAIVVAPKLPVAAMPTNARRYGVVGSNRLVPCVGPPMIWAMFLRSDLLLYDLELVLNCTWISPSSSPGPDLIGRRLIYQPGHQRRFSVLQDVTGHVRRRVMGMESPSEVMPFYLPAFLSHIRLALGYCTMRHRGARDSDC